MAGMTLMEMVVSLAIASILFAMTSGVITAGSDSYKESAISHRLESEVRVALDRVASLLQEASRSSLIPNNLGLTPISQLEFEAPIGLGEAGVLFSSPIMLMTVLRPSELPDGQDNDNNGIIDDCDLIMIRNFGSPEEQRFVLASGIPPMAEGEAWNTFDDNANGMVDEGGFALQVLGATARISLTLQAKSPIAGKIITRSLATAITIRNP